MLVIGLQAGGAAHDTVHVHDRAAVPAHQVVMVVAGSGLVERRRPGRLDAPQDARADAGVQHVVDGLGGDRAQLLPDGDSDGVGVGMRTGRDRVEHRYPRGGDPQTGRSQLLAGIGAVGVHTSSLHLFWN